MSGRHTEPLYVVGTVEWWAEHVAAKRRAVKEVALAVIVASLFGIGIVLWRVFA